MSCSARCEMKVVNRKLLMIAAALSASRRVPAATDGSPAPSRTATPSAPQLLILPSLTARAPSKEVSRLVEQRDSHDANARERAALLPHNCTCGAQAVIEAAMKYTDPSRPLAPNLIAAHDAPLEEIVAAKMDASATT